MITRKILDRLNKWLYLINKPKGAIIFGDVDLEPTQNDKPSNHSSHDLMGEYRKFGRKYNLLTGYATVLVANTNSMEPLFDDNCVLVLEMLRNDWSYRLQAQPFAEGDVVTYDSGLGSIIHVLKYKTTWLGEPAWILQGANNFLPDMSKVLESDIKERLFLIAFCKQRREGD